MDERVDMLKSHIDAYTRSDGTVVQAHEDKRAKKEDLESLSNKYSDHLTRKGAEWETGGKKIPASEIPADAPEFTHKQVYGHDGRSSPVSDDFHPSFAKDAPQHFIIKHKDGRRHLVDTQGARYARYHIPIDDSESRPTGGANSGGSQVDPYDHAMKAGAKNKGAVRVYADAWAAHHAASNATVSQVVMKHPDHDRHVVVGLADGARMEKNGYKVVHK